MFTGIIEDIGTVISVTGAALRVRASLEVAKGDSVSIDGACLTVTAISGKAGAFELSFDYTPETEGITSLSALKPGGRVNLERALKADSRLGGHIVTGHVEGAAAVTDINRKGNSLVLTFRASPGLMKYIVTKGSVAINGISLTVADVSKNGFSVSVIPFTCERTTLKWVKSGQSVNIETDIIAKYVEKTGSSNEKPELTKEFLKEHGYI